MRPRREIQNEPGHTEYNIGSGNFYVSGYGGALDSQMVTDANADLQKVESGVWRTDPKEVVMQFEPVLGNSGPNQSFIYLAPAPVPEPRGVAVLGLGSLVALAASRRRWRYLNPARVRFLRAARTLTLHASSTDSG